MVAEHGTGGHTTIQPEQCHPIAWLCYTWVGAMSQQQQPRQVGTDQSDHFFRQAK